MASKNTVVDWKGTKKITFRIKGLSPLIMHKWSEKAKREMLDKQQKKTVKKGLREPEVMTDSRSSFFVMGEYCVEDQRDLVPVTGELSMREDMVRLNGATSDLRYRGQVSDWEAELDIIYNPISMSPNYLTDMLKIAGFGVGIGEWRPDKDGIFGRFEVRED